MAAGDVQRTMDGDFLADSTPGSSATTVQDNVDEVVASMSKTVYKWLKRGKKWRGGKPTAGDVSVEWKMVKFEGCTFYAMVKSAWLNDTAMAIYAQDASGEGFDLDVYISEFKETQNNEGAVEATVKAEYTDEKRTLQYH